MTLTDVEAVRPFARLSRDDVLYAGGKGANLGELTAAGVPVPPGFVIGAPAYSAFCEETRQRGASGSVRGQRRPRLTRDLEILARPNHDRSHRRSRGGHIDIDAWIIVGAAAERNPEKGQPVSSPGANRLRPFPDPAGEGQNVDPAERRRHRRNPGAQPVDVHLKGERRRGVLGLGGGQHGVHVGGSREPLQP